MDITGTATNMKAAGMAAQADYQSVISQYTSNVAINVSGTADCLAGGIIGYGELNANISNCYVSNAKISSDVTDEEIRSHAGGIAGYTWASGNGIMYITKCHIPADAPGAIAGCQNHNSSFSNCYFTGDAPLEQKVKVTYQRLRLSQKYPMSCLIVLTTAIGKILILFGTLQKNGISLNVQVENIPDNIILVAADANTEGTYTLGQYTGIIGENVFDDIQDAVNNADEGSTIIVAPGEYNGNILFGGKSLTIQAQYLAYKDGVKETDESKLSKFTGTFNAYGDTAESFYADQKIVIDGFALSGDGLKIGNNNYNSVGNLEVRRCTMTFGKNLTNPSDNSYAGLNYFVKANGNNGTPYATVTV